MSKTAKEAVSQAIAAKISDTSGRCTSIEVTVSALEAYHKWLSENGWQIVPKEPTQEMRDAGGEMNCSDDYYSPHVTWEKMINASPKPEIG